MKCGACGWYHDGGSPHKGESSKPFIKIEALTVLPIQGSLSTARGDNVELRTPAGVRVTLWACPECMTLRVKYGVVS